MASFGSSGELPTTRWLRAGKSMDDDERQGLLMAAEPMKLWSYLNQGGDRRSALDSARWPIDDPKWQDTTGLDAPVRADLNRYGVGKSSIERALMSDWLLRRLDAGKDVDARDPGLGQFVTDKSYAGGGAVRGGLARCSCGGSS